MVLSTKTAISPSSRDEQAADERAAAALALAAEGYPVLPLTTPQASGLSCGNPDCGKHRQAPSRRPRTRPRLQRIHAPSATGGAGGLTRTSACAATAKSCSTSTGNPARSRSHISNGASAAYRRHASSAPARGGTFYTVPAGVELGNSTAPLGSPVGIHLRGRKRGYIVAPLSLHRAGPSTAGSTRKHPSPTCQRRFSRRSPAVRLPQYPRRGAGGGRRPTAPQRFIANSNVSSAPRRATVTNIST